jgi:hypothetical protein
MTGEEGKAPPKEEYSAVASWPEHSCYEWNRQVSHVTPEYVSRECGTCGHITGFMWRKRWRRIVSLFTAEALLRTELRWWIRENLRIGGGR